MDDTSKAIPGIDPMDVKFPACSSDCPAVKFLQEARDQIPTAKYVASSEEGLCIVRFEMLYKRMIV